MIYQPGSIDHLKIIETPGIQYVYLFALPNVYFIKKPDGSVFFNTLVDTAVINSNPDFYPLMLVANTFQYSCMPKRSAAGPYYDVKLSGDTNYLTQEKLNHLETFKYCRMQVLVVKKNGTTILVGSPQEGMNFEFSVEEENKQEGLFKVSINLYGQSQDAPPFTNIKR